MRKKTSSGKDKPPDRVATWGDLIEAAQEIIRRNALKNQQLEALVSQMQGHQRAGDALPKRAEIES
jgi:hypothetical protein